MRKRLISAKMLTIGIIAIALTSGRPYGGNSFTLLLMHLFGVTFVILSAVGRIWTSAYISGMKNTTLVTVGPYSIVRNPLYFFSFLGFMGAGLVFGSIVLSISLALVFLLTHWPSILKEEKRLRLSFGQQFDEYCKSTPRFIPKSLKPFAPEELSFKPAHFSYAVAESLLIFLVLPCFQIIQWAQLNSILPTLFLLP